MLPCHACQCPSNLSSLCFSILHLCSLSRVNMCTACTRLKVKFHYSGDRADTEFCNCRSPSVQILKLADVQPDSILTSVHTGIPPYPVLELPNISVILVFVPWIVGVSQLWFRAKWEVLSLVGVNSPPSGFQLSAKCLTLCLLLFILPA